MLTSFLRIFAFFLFFFLCVTSRNQQISKLRIYPHIAEVIKPLNKLPLKFTSEEWYSIRSDSITLVGEDVNITSQSIKEKKNSFNGAEIYIRSPVSIDKTSSIFIKATLIDQDRGLVKVEDDSINGKEVLYFTVSQQDIFYKEEPSDSKISVDFTYNASNSEVFVSYLQSSFNWQAQYQLNLDNDRSDLIVMANIRNNGKSSVSVDQAELFSGDINIRLQNQQYNSYDSFRNMQVSTNYVPAIGKSEELMGIHAFLIDKPFVIDAQGNYLLPMFQPHISVERYTSISKSFSSTLTSGKAQRSYRLKSNRYLSNGNCIIREFDRIVGETSLPNIATKDAYEFSIGEDDEVIYSESVTLLPPPQLTETAYDVNSNPTFIQRRTGSVYEIHVRVKNSKNRSIKVEYTQQLYYLQPRLINSTDNLCVQDGLFG
jgi:hypothetical protein